MRKIWGLGAAACLAAVALPAVADAQNAPPFDPAIDVQTFEYAIGPKTFFTVSDGDIAQTKQLAVDALVTFLTRPFTVYNVDPAMPDQLGAERTEVVDTLTALQITAAYGINDKLQIGANLPVIFSLSGDGLMPNTAQPDPNGLSVTGLGDLFVEAKYRLYRKNRLRISALGGISIPTSFGSDDSQFIGDNLPTVRARMALQQDVGRFSFGANAGAIFRKPRTIYDSTIGQQLTWGVAGAARLTDRFSLIAEGYGRAGLPDFSLDASPLEVEGGLRVYATPAVAVVIGGGAGLVKGIGSPESRFFLAIGYAPDVRDSDGDGIQNSRDKCPMIAEDRDGQEDDDGCPDDDSDGDRRPDAEDKCPTVAEDLDGFEDDDGCPEIDNDGDKLNDLDDKCPNEAEDGKQPYPNDGCPANRRDSDGDGMYDDKDQCPLEEEDLDAFEDGDGCPEADNDADGVPDASDKCSLCPEDKDGFEDGDGCPELDNDHDGIVDSKDVCPAEPETINGIKDDDGCPDAGPQTVKVDGDRLAVDKVPTIDRKGALTKAGALIVDQMALTMLQHPEVTKWLIAVSQPKQADAQKLADAIKARLTTKGVNAAILNVVGAQGPAKIAGVVQERGEGGDDTAAPVCPAGMEVKQRPEASKPEPTKASDIEVAP
ncbi:MAG TPA: transporter [Kofleriaceae bacterium]|jgi:hypothetical protein|nr:transporter [Kofleriaceae bacterium]